MNERLLGGYQPSDITRDTPRFVMGCEGLPTSFSCQKVMPPVENQGSTQHCVAHSCSAMVNYLLNTERKTVGIDYGIEEIEIYNQRKDRSKDIGMSPKVALEYIRTKGVNITSLGTRYQISGYGLVTELKDLKNAIVMNGPVLTGLFVRSMVGDDFWRGDGKFGGHAVTIVGYNDRDRMLLLRNSWGTTYGTMGYHLLPYDVWDEESIETWTIY